MPQLKPVKLAMDGSEEKVTIKQYDELVAEESFYSRHFRFLLSSQGLFFLQTPVYRLKRLVPIRPEDMVLDIGCGRGSVIQLLKRKVPLKHEPVCIDATRYLLNLAQEHAVNTSAPGIFLQGTATALPFNEASFDIALCSYVVKHFNDQDLKRLLCEACRVLKPGGRLALWEFAPAPFPPLRALHERVMKSRVKAEYLRHATELEDVLEKAGFSEVKRLRLGLFLYPPVPRAALRAIK